MSKKKKIEIEEEIKVVETKEVKKEIVDKGKIITCDVIVTYGDYFGVLIDGFGVALENKNKHKKDDKVKIRCIGKIGKPNFSVSEV